MLIKKGKDKRKNGKPVQRYQCKACGTQFTSAVLVARTFHQPDLLNEIFLRYTSGYSVSRLAEELRLDKKTVLRAIHFLGEKCRAYHQELLDTGFLATDKIQFDEMEGYIHSKIYPVSIGLAVDVLYKRIIDIRVAEIKLKGQLKLKVQRDCGGVLPAKVLTRPNNSPAMLDDLMKSINKALRARGTVLSDEKPAYKTLVKNHLPNNVRFIQEESKILLEDSADSQALGRFRSVCAHLRTYMSSLGRRKQITVKTMKSMECHFAMMIARYNKYDLREILNHGKIKEDFFEREWRIRKEKKLVRNTSPIVVAHLWKRKQNQLVATLACLLYLRSKQVPEVVQKVA